MKLSELTALAVCAAAMAAGGCAEGPAGPYKLTCKVTLTKPAAVAGPAKEQAVVQWKFVNDSTSDVWVPVKYDYTFGDPQTPLPLVYLAPGGTLMAVSGAFEACPGRKKPDQGQPVVELARVAPGAKLSGELKINLPLTAQEGPGDVPSNPFTPWGAGKFLVPLEAKPLAHATKFQMAVQAYRLPPSVVELYRTMQKTTSPDRLVVRRDWLSFDLIADNPNLYSRFVAQRLLEGQNRRVRADDFATWAFSPAYEVNLPIGQHGPVGIRK